MLVKNNNSAKQNSDEKIRTLTIWDVVLILFAIAGAGYSIPIIQANKPSEVVIYKDNNLYAKYPLTVDREFSVNGHEGLMKIRIHDSHVSVCSSTCRKQICVKSGKISKPYQQLICAPNHVLIEIQSNKERDTIDAITR